MDHYNQPPNPPSPPIIAIAGWLVPGLGYALIGERARALIVGTTIVAIFILGLLIAGVRCIDVPGYDANGELRQIGRNQTLIGSAPLAAIRDKPWYIPQILAGPLTIGASVWSVSASAGAAKATGRLWDIGTLYTAVAGMLNLLVIIDAAYRSAKIREDNPRLGPM
jgi:hypothetical protein